MKAKLIVVKYNTIGKRGNEFVGPEEIEAEKSFKPIIQQKFETTLKGIPGYVLVLFNDKLFQCERDNTNPEGPYVKHTITWHPLAEKFKEFTSQSKDRPVVPLTLQTEKPDVR